MASASPEPQPGILPCTDRGTTIEIALGTLLRWGTIISGLVIAIGGIAYLAIHGQDTPHFAVFKGEPVELSTVDGILRSALRLESRNIMQLGMLLLVATPVARVIGALVAFAWMRDRQYVAIAAFVLVALVYSLFAT